MIRFVVLAVALLIFLTMAFFLLLGALILVAMACLVGIPLWLMSKRWMRRQGIAGPGQHPIDRLRNLYVEDKIDLFEFERRVAHHLSKHG